MPTTNRGSVLVALMVALLAGPISADESSPTAQSLCAELESTLNSYRTLVVKYRSPYLPDLIPDARNRAEPHDPIEFEWRQIGKDYYFRKVSPAQWKSSLGFGECAFVNRTAYDVIAHPALPRQVSLRDAPDSSALGHFTLDLFVGQRLMGTDMTLLDVLRSPNAGAPATDAVNGVPCWRVAVPGQVLFDSPCTVTAWLDPAHGHLPSRITTAAENADWKKTFEVREFSAIREVGTEAQRWFPKSVAVIQMVGEYRFEIVDVRLNGPLDTRALIPEMPDGTNVYDHRAGVTGSRSSIVGGYAASSALVSNLAAQATEAARDGYAPPDASTQSAFGAARIVLFLSVALLAGVTVFTVAARLRNS